LHNIRKDKKVTVWIGDYMVAELNGSGTVTPKHISRVNLIAAEDVTGVRKYYLYTRYGDVIQLRYSVFDVIICTVTNSTLILM